MMGLRHLLLLSIFVVLAYSAERINVHVIAHTHDDVGWLKTVDEYYYGANQSIQDAGVQYIIDTTVQALQEHPHRRFIYVEIAFFMRWWREQSEFKRSIVRNLVANGQWEFINGGWVMNDEATVSHTAVIEQMSEGHEFLFREFGVKPRIGWHIDPFGHAASQASIFAQMGFDAFFFGRIDYKDHDIRNETKQLEFVWRGSQSLGAETEIFTHVLYTDYCYLPGFGWEYGAEPIKWDPNLQDVNIKERADDFANQVRRRAWSNQTPNLLVPFGCDFQFENAHMEFKNMDRLIDYLNANSDVYNLNVFYSTPTTYMEAVHAAGHTWEVKTGDFLPYADDPHSYWSGYYSSRSALKGYVRSRNNFLHATQNLLASTSLPFNIGYASHVKEIQVLTQAFSTAQHHDAVSGTEKQHVADDYAKRLSIGTVACEGVIADVMQRVVAKTATKPTFTFCRLINESICPATDALTSANSIAVVAYNARAHESVEVLRIPIKSNAVVLGPDGTTRVKSQLYVNEDGVKTVAFEARLPALGFSTYFLQYSATEEVIPVKNIDAEQILENDHIRVVFDGQTNRLKNITNKDSGKTIVVDQQLMWWNASAGNNNVSQQASGAYIFRPNGTVAFNMSSTQIPTVTSVMGSIVSTVTQVWNKWAKQTFRLYQNANFLEVEATIGPIDISDHLGKEVIARYTTDLKTGNTWYSDSEGQEFIERKTNSRPYPYNITEPVAMNYVPMNLAAYIRDTTKGDQLTLVSDRTRGCASLKDGQFENMLHRRLLYDDGRGVGEPLNESNIVRTTERIMFDPIANASRKFRHEMASLNQPPVLMFANVASVSQYTRDNAVSFSAMKAGLPANVELITFKMLNTGQILLRLQNVFAVGEDKEMSASVSVDLNALFPALQIDEITEVSLSANQPASEVHRLQWKTAGSMDDETARFQQELYREDELIIKDNVKDPRVALKAQQIRSFIIRYFPIGAGKVRIA
eukprot:TRINITY_DN1714_c0_g1_i1.p1 TRINITY_DN1714_c0_g1~~TRINITY_DN1714_c0_g1_i1.p1  ORF type:complete len:977 (+),score=300.90 TRINITY_DN1714_c0_g1_i1:52-2982(+)